MTMYNGEKPFFIKAVGGKKIKLSFNDVYFLRASREYVEIITDSKTYLIHSTFKKMRPAFLQFECVTFGACMGPR